MPPEPTRRIDLNSDWKTLQVLRWVGIPSAVLVFIVRQNGTLARKRVTACALSLILIIMRHLAPSLKYGGSGRR